VSKVLDVFEEKGNEAISRLKKGLEKSNASMSLSQSIDYNVKRFSDGSYVWSLSMEDYYTFVNDGRPPGKMPPVEKIEEWITEKGIRVEKRVASQTYKAKYPKKPLAPMTAKVKATSTLTSILKNRRSMAFAIAKNIGKKGTKGNKFFDNVINQSFIEDFTEKLAEAGLKDFETQFDLLIK